MDLAFALLLDSPVPVRLILMTTRHERNCSEVSAGFGESESIVGARRESVISKRPVPRQRAVPATNGNVGRDVRFATCAVQGSRDN